MPMLKLGPWKKKGHTWERHYYDGNNLAIRVTVKNAEEESCFDLYDRDGGHISEGAENYNDHEGNALQKATVRAELFLNAKILPADRTAGLEKKKAISECVSRDYDEVYDTELGEANSDGSTYYDRAGNLYESGSVTFAEVDNINPAVATTHNDDNRATTDINAKESSVNEITGKQATSDIMLEGLEMGAISSIIEKGAKELLKRSGGDPENAVAIHGAKIALVLMLKHLGIPVFGDKLPKKEFVERRIDLALKGVTATASYEATTELFEVIGPVMTLLAEDGPALMRMLTDMPSPAQDIEVGVGAEKVGRGKSKSTGA